MTGDEILTMIIQTMIETMARRFSGQSWFTVVHNAAIVYPLPSLVIRFFADGASKNPAILPGHLQEPLLSPTRFHFPPSTRVTCLPHI